MDTPSARPAAATPGLRPAGPGDADVLFRVYASTREEELAVVPWDAASKEAFLLMQFTAQPVQMHVEQFNPARRLYARLGFRQIEEQGVYLLLERKPGG